jgi:calcineurin-like phosphoesterase family protein
MIDMLYDKFKPWAETGNIWLYSDTHFDDFDCRLMAEDWPLPQQQVEIINQLVHKNDTFVLLGDVGNPEYIQQLKAGKKILIAGNHDKGLSNYKMFDEAYGGPLFVADKILLSHEPIDLGFGLNIHGHDHQNLGYGKANANHFCVCSNTIDYTPVCLDKIIKAGYVKNTDSIHRITIDEASKNSFIKHNSSEL